MARPDVGGDRPVYWLAMVTSAKRSAWIGDVPIPDLTEAGVHGPCVVRSAKIVTLEHARIVRRIGRVTPALLAEVRGHLRRELDQ